MPRAGIVVPVLLPALLSLAACEANFRDLRPEDSLDRSFRDVDRRDTGPDAGGDESRDAGDSGVRSDTASGDSGAEGRLVAKGTFESRDYSAKGTVRLWELGDGSWELRLGSDFEVDSTPGPVVVLTTRTQMGSEIKSGEGDKELGVLRSDSGADQYEVPGGPGSRRNAFIFCKPFGGEIGRAIMEAP